ncbi:DUF2069 domain-containing protein [Thalassotalea mangrovi]|uniref:DUF2069 domain-containing protein n=1 Tax=Thalassotalea mangrovi TaxID=2572245 RepID=A0A4U1B3B4_9GAMM|nr:DUF2069 domain-containing protein [Thalassotalea mangrovi]TKB44367.1 DUF2069 domain-containing protein [Thalassotalea mangrovi]
MRKQTFSTPTLKRIALAGYFGLLIFMPVWLIYLSPSEGLSPVLAVAMFVIPLLFPLPGLIKGNPYTFAWANFIVMIYFLHSLTTLWVSPEERWLAVIELIFACMMFFAGTYYSKYKGQELGLGLKKNRKEKK